MVAWLLSRNHFGLYIMNNSPLTNPHYISVWRAECTKAVQQDPNNQAALFLQLAFNNLFATYVQPTAANTNSLQHRNEICDYIREAGKSGDPRGMFFEGLVLQGFGCKPDLITSEAFIRVAAFGRNCDLALQFLTLRLGQAQLFGYKMQQDYAAAIISFKKAGAIAHPELDLIKMHLSKLRAKLEVQPEANVINLEQAPRVVQVASLRIS